MDITQNGKTVFKCPVCQTRFHVECPLEDDLSDDEGIRSVAAEGCAECVEALQKDELNESRYYHCTVCQTHVVLHQFVNV